ncbi:MAG: hypothetical protein H6550_13135 [Chitinophagales bacterium]|nr:hypothetical protein [Chitinophagales bacterium]
MENTAKKYGKILCFTPITLFAAWTIYFFSIVQEQVVTSSFSNHFHWVAAMASSYTSLWISLSLICIITASIMLYFVVHIARLRQMTALEKVLWIVAFPALGSVAFILFWFIELKEEPENVDVYASIA